MKMAETLHIEPNATCTKGHFLGNALVPGAYLLGCVNQAIQKLLPGKRLSKITKVKFFAPLRPGTSSEITLEALQKDAVKFSIYCEQTKILSGKGELSNS